MKYDAVIFDLDGTLADTLQDLAAATNHALQTMNKPTHSLEAYRLLVGRGVNALLTDAMESPSAREVERGIDLFRQYYALHQLDDTRPYPGIAALLDRLMEHQVKCCVLSNKPDPATQKVVNHLFGRGFFERVLGHCDRYPLKPDPTSLKAMMAQINVLPKRCLYVGDTKVDMQTAKRAGAFAVGVRWGFRDEAELREHGADVIVSTPDEIFHLLDV